MIHTQAAGEKDSEVQGRINGDKIWKQKQKLIRVCFCFVSFWFGSKKLHTQREKWSPQIIKHKLKVYGT